MSANKSSYTAVFNKYEYIPKEIFGKIIYFKNVRTDKGCLIKEWILDERILPEPLIGHLTTGEIVSFDANIEIKDIEICYPDGGKNAR